MVLKKPATKPWTMQKAAVGEAKDAAKDAMGKAADATQEAADKLKDAAK